MWRHDVASEQTAGQRDEVVGEIGRAIQHHSADVTIRITLMAFAAALGSLSLTTSELESVESLIHARKDTHTLHPELSHLLWLVRWS